MKLHLFTSPACLIAIFLATVTTFPSNAQSPLSSSGTDTVFGFNFQVNLTKAVQLGIFRPDSDFVYVVLDQGISPMSLVPGPSFTYSAIVTGLDSGNTYIYKYRINDTLFETVSRTVTATQGITTIKTWWNQEALNYTAFEVNMTYAVESGIFNPVSDYLQVLGTMNNWTGSSHLFRIGTTYSYFTTYTLDPGSVQQYKFRINGDSTGLELLNKPNRMVHIPDTLLEVVNFFDNYNPATLPMSFNCDMEYYLRMAHFNPMNDYLDVAGNFNGWGQNDVLFDDNHDSIYTLVKYLDTAYVHGSPLEFKFRINGNWATSELTGKPNRVYSIHDTTGLNPNYFYGWYDDKDPRIPSPPWAYNVSIQGKLLNHQVLSGMYSYEDVNGRPEDSTTFQWFRCDDPLMTNLTPIDTAHHITYTIDTLDIGKYLVFEVTPRATGGDSAIGKPVRVITESKIGGVGIQESENIISKVYPNPVSGTVTIESALELSAVELMNYFGQKVMEIDGNNRMILNFDLSSLPPGLYMLKASTRDRKTGVIKIIKH